MGIEWTWNAEEAMRVVGVLGDAGVKGTVVLLLAWGVTWGMRRGSAAVRHWVWVAALVGIVMVPVLGAVMPGWGVLPRWAGVREESRVVAMVARPGDMERGRQGDWETGGQGEGGAGVVGARVEKQSGPVLVSVPWVMVLVWGLGVGVMVVPVVVGMMWVRGLRRRSLLAGGEWGEMLGRLKAEAGVKRGVELRENAGCVVPLTFGVWRPVIVMPGEAKGWSEERRRMALLHELGHVARWDCLTQVLVRLVRAMYWFHPLAWVAAGRAMAECERACDDRVLGAGAKSSTYAEALMEYAAPLAQGGKVPMVALAMARVSTLEGRLLAILDGRRNRRGVTWRWVVGVLVVIAAFAAGLAVMRQKGGDVAAMGHVPGVIAYGPNLLLLEEGVALERGMIDETRRELKSLVDLTGHDPDFTEGHRTLNSGAAGQAFVAWYQWTTADKRIVRVEQYAAKGIPTLLVVSVDGATDVGVAGPVRDLLARHSGKGLVAAPMRAAGAGELVLRSPSFYTFSGPVERLERAVRGLAAGGAVEQSGRWSSEELETTVFQWTNTKGQAVRLKCWAPRGFLTYVAAEVEGARDENDVLEVYNGLAAQMGSGDGTRLATASDTQALPSKVENVQLKETNAAEVARLINAMFDPANARAKPGDTVAARTNPRMNATADSRTNTVIVTGPEEQVSQALEMIRRLEAIPVTTRVPGAGSATTWRPAAGLATSRAPIMLGALEKKMADAAGDLVRKRYEEGGGEMGKLDSIAVRAPEKLADGNWRVETAYTAVMKAGGKKWFRGTFIFTAEGTFVGQEHKEEGAEMKPGEAPATTRAGVVGTMSSGLILSPSMVLPGSWSAAMARGGAAAGAKPAEVPAGAIGGTSRVAVPSSAPYWMEEHRFGLKKAKAALAARVVNEMIVAMAPGAIGGGEGRPNNHAEAEEATNAVVLSIEKSKNGLFMTAVSNLIARMEATPGIETATGFAEVWEERVAVKNTGVTEAASLVRTMAKTNKTVAWRGGAGGGGCAQQRGGSAWHDGATGEGGQGLY